MEILELEGKPMNPLNGLREYLVIISPPTFIKNDVWEFKNEFFEHFGNAKYVRSQPHISLSNFLIESTPETTIFKELYHFLKDGKSFEIKISGFESFENSKTLFLEVAETKIVDLQKKLVEVLRKRAKIANRFTRKLEKPHITIASNIPDYQFD
ncbi:2'-5' RNA ligase family protein [Maribacter sp. X9]|uniref:2'-5' RNA ligase family protein n=1 Tax=Maribacter sp. X9 TaxID=3402159 RepID=UPI003AF37E8F